MRERGLVGWLAGVLGWQSKHRHVATRVSCANNLGGSVRASTHTYAFCEHDFRTSISSKSSAKSDELRCVGVCVCARIHVEIMHASQ